MEYKWYAALAYVRANKLNYNVISTPHDRFGIIASGKAYNDTRQAMQQLGLDEDSCRRIGLRLHKVRSGQTLGEIARRYQTSVQRLCELNGLGKSDLLRVGSTLKVP